MADDGNFDAEPEARLERRGRWLWQITITHGLLGLSPGWFAYGKRRAERKALRKLAWYRRTYCEPRETVTIRG